MVITKWEDLAMGAIYFLLALMANGVMSLSSMRMRKMLHGVDFRAC